MKPSGTTDAIRTRNLILRNMPPPNPATEQKVIIVGAKVKDALFGIGLSDFSVAVQELGNIGAIKIWLKRDSLETKIISALEDIGAIIDPKSRHGFLKLDGISISVNRITGARKPLRRLH